MREVKEKEKDDQPQKEEDRLMLINGQASEQVDFAITQELMSTPIGLKVLRLWRATDWTKARTEVEAIAKALNEQPVLEWSASPELLAEHRYVQICLEVDELAEFDVRERARALDLIEEYATKQVGVR